MSEQQHDADPGYGPVAQPAVDILPALSGRKGRPADEPTAPEPVDPTWAQPGPQALGPVPAVNPWNGMTQSVSAETQPVETQTAAPAAPPAPPAPYGSAVQAPVQAPFAAVPAQAPVQPAVQAPVPPTQVPVFPGAMVSAVPLTQNPMIIPSADSADPAVPAKRFLGMQLRRPRKEGAPPDPDQQYAGPPAPVAAWPTDAGVSVVADAEPATPRWAPPIAYAPLDAPPAEAPRAYAPPVEAPITYAPPVEAPMAYAPPVEAPPVEAPPSEASLPAAPVPDAAPVSDAAPASGSQPFAFHDQPALPVQATAPAATAPVPLPAEDDELHKLRALLEASEARRSAAEHRADQAVGYGQQMQAELARVTADLEGRLQAAEIRIRSAANEAQDWQIRHREAEVQVAELANSVGGAEQRLFELRVERDGLLAALEEATNPDRAAVAEQLAEG